MRGLLRRWIFSGWMWCAVLSLFATNILAESTRATDPRERLESRIRYLLQKTYYPAKNVGICITDLDTGNILFSFNPDMPMKPASNMKIITTAAALEVMGPAFLFNTEVYTRGGVKNGILSGDLILKGGGDPFLVKEHLWRLADAVALEGITRISGNILLDASLYDGEKLPDADWKRIKMPLRYNAPTSALSFNFNMFSVCVAPAKSTGMAPKVHIDPRSGYFIMENKAVTCGRCRKDSLIMSIEEKDGRCKIKLTGSIPSHYRPQKYHRHVSEPELYCGTTFADYLRMCHVEFSGKILKGKMDPEKDVLLVKQESRPLSVMLRDANKFSNNFMMEQVLKMIAVERYGNCGSTAGGIAAVREVLQRMDVPLEGFVMKDGSGLSRKNRVTPRQFSRIIRYMVLKSVHAPEFINVFPVAGVDGTLKKRMRKQTHHELVRAKTGFINGVSTLSGLVDGRGGHGVIFSIMLNQIHKYKVPAKRIQDDIVRSIIRYLDS